MKILLIYPKYPNTFWSYTHTLKYIRKKAIYPPLGLLTVAAMLPHEWDKRLVDVNVRDLTDKDIDWADMVMVGAMLVQRNSSQEIFDRCKSRGKTVVAGGPAFTTEHEAYSNVDHFVLNEAEVTLPLFLNDLAQGKPKRIYTTSERPPITNTPVPLWSLIRLKDYATLPIQYSRGCPFNCEFCDIIIMNGRKPRTKTPRQMIREFQSLYDLGWRGSIFIVDDNFIGNKKNAKLMLRSLVKWQKEHRYPYSLLTEASTNLADDQQMMDLMREANFNKVFLGIETPNVASLKECGKSQNVGRDLSKAIRKINQNGLQVMGGFIIGFDSDTKSIFDSQIKFIQDNGVVTAMVGLLNALPQTALWKRLKVEDRLLNSHTSGENTDGTINFEPKMKKKELIQGYKKVLGTIYSREQYYKRIKTLLKSYVPSNRSKMSGRDVRAFFLSMWGIGVMSRARANYWDLLLKTALTNWKAFPTAVELAIVGQHYERITEMVLKAQ